MKILVYGYYDDFSFFFSRLGEYHARRNSEVEYYFATNNLSGYFSWPSNNKALILPHFLRKKTENSSFSSKQIREMGEYYLLNFLEIPFSKINSKVNFIESIINKVNPDKVILSGDVRPTSKIIQYCIKRRNCDIWFFEQGPLKTTVFSKSGVNANLLPNNLPNRLANKIEEDSIKISSTQKRYYRLLDVLQSFSSDPEASFNISVMLHKFFRRAKNCRSKAIEKRGKKIVLLALQVPDDINFTFHSSFATMLQLLKFILSNLPKNILLIIREHPMYKGSYGDNVYNLVENHKQAFLDANCPGEGVEWDHIDGFLAVNSLMVFEAIEKGTPAGMLGRATFSSLVEDCQSQQRLRDFFSKISNNQLSAPSALVITDFIDRTYLKGHFREPTEGLFLKMTQLLEGKY